MQRLSTMKQSKNEYVTHLRRHKNVKMQMGLRYMHTISDSVSVWCVHLCIVHFAFDIVTSLSISISFSFSDCVQMLLHWLLLSYICSMLNSFHFVSTLSAFIVFFFLNALDGGDDVRLCTCVTQFCLII